MFQKLLSDFFLVMLLYNLYMIVFIYNIYVYIYMYIFFPFSLSRCFQHFESQEFPIEIFPNKKSSEAAHWIGFWTSGISRKFLCLLWHQQQKPTRGGSPLYTQLWGRNRDLSGLNSDGFRVIIAHGHQPKSTGRFFFKYKDSLLRVGWPIPHIATFDPVTYELGSGYLFFFAMVSGCDLFQFKRNVVSTVLEDVVKGHEDCYQIITWVCSADNSQIRGGPAVWWCLQTGLWCPSRQTTALSLGWLSRESDVFFCFKNRTFPSLWGVLVLVAPFLCFC